MLLEASVHAVNRREVLLLLLGGFMLALGKFFQTRSVLLLLLLQLLIHLACLLSLSHELLDQMLALIDLVGQVEVDHVDDASRACIVDRSLAWHGNFLLMQEKEKNAPLKRIFIPIYLTKCFCFKLTN
ncbi:hypothetical protein ACFSR7_26430 [Cohnella sp. GCM10020058]|uniref:hypothetical protein n=1 Tax=Cohnella sp. GCM10020058 TaxID=3317330 RepID=UPI0036346121